MKNDNKKQPAVIKANMKLQQKVGKGPLDDKLLKPAQKVIDNNDVDFNPLGLEIIKRLERALEQASDSAAPMSKVKESLTAPVMELKANASTFRYTLIGDLANIMLRFLEAMVVMDKEAVDIVRAHHQSLRMIITQKITGDGGKIGQDLKTELQGACDRYFQKKYKK